MNQAIIGVIGVVVGGAIAVFAQQLRPDARSVRGAARLLHEELDLTLKYAEVVLQAQSWGAAPSSRAFSAQQWSDRRSLFAAELGRRDWISVKTAYKAVETIQAAKRSDDDGNLSEAEHGPLEGAVREIRDAGEVLDALSGRWPTITQSWRRKSRG